MTVSAHVALVAWKCVTDARRLLGDGWAHVSDDLRWGLVCANVMGVIAGQHAMDDPNATEGEKARVAEYAVELWRYCAEIRDAKWSKPPRKADAT